MAKTLGAVMRLTDEYTATMQKIIQSSDAYNKKQEQATNATKQLQSSIRGLGSTPGSVTSGFTSLAMKIGAVATSAKVAKSAVGLLFDAIKTGAQQQVQLRTFESLMGNKQLGSDLYNYVQAYAKESAMSRGDLAGATQSFLAYTRNTSQLKQLLDITQRLYMWNPEQGGEGAVFAIKEILSGQTMSLKNRFNINGLSSEKITNMYNQGDTAGIIKYLDEAMTKVGATQDVVNQNFKTLTVQSQNFATNFKDAMGNQASPAVQGLTETLIYLNSQMKAGEFQGFFDAVANGANAVAKAGAWLAENYRIVIPVVAAVISAFVLFNAAMAATNFLVLTGAITANIAAQNWIGLGVAIAGAVGAGALASKLLNTDLNSGKATAQVKSAAEAAAKLAADQKKYGASTKGSSANAPVSAKVTNSNPIKVSGTVEIQKENLKYVFEATAAKFFAQFNTTKVEPAVNIQNQNVSKEVDVNTLNYAMGGIVSEYTSTHAGGYYK